METFVTTFQDKTTRVFWNIEEEADNIDDAVKQALVSVKKLEAIDEQWDLVRCARKAEVDGQAKPGAVCRYNGARRARVH
jgi:hypothetical protein